MTIGDGQERDGKVEGRCSMRVGWWIPKKIATAGLQGVAGFRSSVFRLDPLNLQARL